MIRPHRISKPTQWAIAGSFLALVGLAAFHVGSILFSWLSDSLDREGYQCPECKLR